MAKTKRNHVSKQGALTQVAEYIINCENSEYDSYVSYCQENELAPFDIRGLGQSNHVYALALIGLGLEFPCEHSDTDGPRCLDCGADLTEKLASAAHDKAKNRAKYGD